MACEQFRYLIQQQFDVELPREDESQLSAHLSSCETCERFHFQMDQIIRTAADLDLPDDATPENLESLARIIIQQLPKPKSGPLSFITNLFGNKKAATKETPKASHTPKASSRFPHVRRNQSTTNQNVGAEQGEEPPIEDHSQSISTTLSGRFGRGAHDVPAEPEGPLTLADTIRRKVQEEKQAIPEPPAEQESNANAWAGTENMTPMPPPAPQGQAFAQANFQEDNRYAPAGGAWEEPAWSQPPPVPTTPPEAPNPNPLASIDLMGQTADAQSNAWSNSSAPPPPPVPTTPSFQSTGTPSDLEQGLWQAQQNLSEPQQPQLEPDSQQKAWSDEAEQLQTGFWQAFSPEQESGLKGPAGMSSVPPPPPVPMPQGSMPAPPAPMPQGSIPAQDDSSRYDIPIQERLAQEKLAQEKLAAQNQMDSTPQAPPVPIAPPVPSPEPASQAPAAQAIPEAGNEPKSIISRLSSILGDTPGQAANPQLLSESPMDFGTPEPPARPLPQESPLSASAPPPPPLPIQAPIPQPAVQPAAVSTPATQSQPVAQPASAPQPVAAQTPQPQAPQPASSGLFNVDESAIDKIFSENLGIVDATSAVNPGQQISAQAAAPQAPAAPPLVQAPAQAPPPAPAQVPPPTPPAPAVQMPVSEKPKEQGLFADMDDAAIDQLFSSNLGISEHKGTSVSQPAAAIPQPIPAMPPPPAPVPPPPPVVEQAPTYVAPQPIPVEPPAQVPPPPAPPTAIAEIPPAPPVAPIPVAPIPAAAIPAAPIPAAPIPAAPIPAAPIPAAPIPAAPIPAAPIPAAPIPAAPAPPPAPVPSAQIPEVPSEPPISIAPQAAPAQQNPPSDGMFNVSESDLDKLFSENLGVSDSALSSAPKVNLTQAVETIRHATESTAPPPKIEGVGRLSKNIDTTQDTSSGKISSIGKFLLDQKDLAKLGKVASTNLSSTDMRVLTMEAAQELQTLLSHIGNQPGVAGSVIVGHDGILIANNLPAGHDAESVGVWALGIFLNTENTIKMLGHNHVFQMVARTPQGFLVIADFGGGILVTVSQSSQTNELIPLMRTITQLVAQTAH